MRKIYDSVTQRFYNSEDEMKLAQNQDIIENNNPEQISTPEIQKKNVNPNQKVYNTETMRFENVGGSEVSATDEFVPVKTIDRLKGLEDSPVNKTSAVWTTAKMGINLLGNLSAKSMIAVENLIEKGSSGDATQELEDFDKMDISTLDISDKEKINIFKITDGINNYIENSPMLKNELTEAGNFVDYSQGLASGAAAGLLTLDLDNAKKIFGQVAGDLSAERFSSTGGQELGRDLGNVLDEAGYHPLVSAIAVSAPQVIEVASGYGLGSKATQLFTKKIGPGGLTFLYERGGLKKLEEKLYSGKKGAIEELDAEMNQYLRTDEKAEMLKLLDLDGEVMKAAKDEGIDLSTSTAMNTRRDAGIDDTQVEKNKVVQAYIKGVTEAASERGIFKYDSRQISQLENRINKVLKTDSSDIDLSLKTFVKNEVARDEIKSDALYDIVNKQVDKTNRVMRMSNLGKLIDETKITEGLKGTPQKFETIIKKIWAEKSAPTYGRLDSIRKDINQSLYNNKGSFKDMNEDFLKSVKSAIDTDQRNFIGREYGKDVLNSFDEAQLNYATSIEKKKIYQEAIGDDFSDSMTSKLNSEFNSLSAKGTINSFNKKFELVPEEFKRDILKSMVSNSLVNDKGTNVNGLSNLYSNLVKNKKSMKEFKKHLSDEEFQHFVNFGKISNAIKRDNSNKYKKSSASLKATEDDNRGFVDKFIGGMGNVFAGSFIFPMVRVAGIGIQSAQKGLSSDLIKDSSKILNSPKFQRLWIEASKPDFNPNKRNVKKAEKEIENSPEFKNFRTSLKNFANRDYDKLVGLGLAGYLQQTAEQETPDVFYDENGDLNIKVTKKGNK